MIKYCIYKHETPNGKVYIGQTMRPPEVRWQNGGGYNLTSGGESNHTHSEHVLEYMSEVRTALARSDSPPINVKLNMDIVNEIREFYQNNDISHRALAVEYGISQAQMTQILNNNKWVDSDYVNHKRKAMWDSKIERAESIRASYQSYEYETHELMKLHNLGHDAVRDIINNTTWVDDEYENVRDKVEREEGMQRARDIRALYATGEYTQMELADKYNMSGGQVCDLIQHNIWADN